MQSLPVFLVLKGRPVILTGSGEAVDAKRRLLERAGARVVGEAEDAAIAIVADGDDATVARLKARGVLVNATDRPELCDFTLPAIIDRNPVLIAIGTGGASAGLAKALRQRIEAILPEKLGRLATALHDARAAIRAHVIAESAEFFSFGTNDLTQTTFGISRDDAASFLEIYRQKGIIEQDPFVSLDIDGVGELVRLAAEKGRSTRPEIKLGICGEHGGDPASIHFCEEVGLDYVSCSPYRVPIARLAAAQAAVKKG